jgi:outer membrane murein-binding lipoprotein Lpp
MSTSLYVLADEYRAAADRLSELDLDEQTVLDTLDGMVGKLEAKAANVAMFVRSLESSADQIKQAEEAMAERRKAIKARADRIRAYLLENMEKAKISKIDCPYFSLSIRENPPSVVIDAAGQIPSDYYAYPAAPEPYPDKKLIAKAIKDGCTVNGAHIQRTKRIEIK